MACDVCIHVYVYMCVKCECYVTYMHTWVSLIHTVQVEPLVLYLVYSISWV